MKSTIRIAIDDAGKPFLDIRVDKHSEDMRDQSLRRFFEQMSHRSVYCKVYYGLSDEEKYHAQILPISPDLLKDEGLAMQEL